jgi:hypothetical protein
VENMAMDGNTPWLDNNLEFDELHRDKAVGRSGAKHEV